MKIVHHPSLPLLACISGRKLVLFEHPATLNAKCVYEWEAPAELNPSHADQVNELLAVALSPDGRRLAFTTIQKAVYVVEKKSDGEEDDWTLVWQGFAKKRISKLVFSSSGESGASSLLYADRFGDVYRVDPDGKKDKQQEEEEGTKLLMGHVSMITDMLLSPSNNILVTAERDEKIRVTAYPETHIIHQFLFGHQQFVTSIAFPPSPPPQDQHQQEASHSPQRLISGGGDPFLLIWNLEPNMDDTRRIVGEFHLGNVVQEAMGGVDKVDMDAFAVRKLVCVQRAGDSRTACDVLVVLERIPKLFVLRYEEDALTFRTAVPLSSFPLDMSFTELGGEGAGEKAVQIWISLENPDKTQGQDLVILQPDSTNKSSDSSHYIPLSLTATATTPLMSCLHAMRQEAPQKKTDGFTEEDSLWHGKVMRKRPYDEGKDQFLRGLKMAKIAQYELPKLRSKAASAKAASLSKEEEDGEGKGEE